MNTKLVALRQCADRVEAETIRIRLASEEIPALITGTDPGAALSLGGAATSRLVRVEVDQSDYELADALLKSDRQRTQTVGPWICQRCCEHNESAFDVCWSCTKIRETRENEEKRVGDETWQQLTPLDQIEQPKKSVPSAPVVNDDGLVDDPIEVHNESVSRCSRAATVGLLILPPFLCVYAIYLLLRLDPAVYQDPRTRTRVWLIWAANVLILLLGTAFWVML